MDSEHELPDVFEVFALSSTPTDEDWRNSTRSKVSKGRSYCWTARMSEQLDRWREREDQGERPRTYDKFYKQYPGNLMIENTGSKKDNKNDEDSAISVGSDRSDSGEDTERGRSRERKITRRSQSERRARSRTLTEVDVKHIERHLSMKKTIRKKIMRDLTGAFVELEGEKRKEKENVHLQCKDSLQAEMEHGKSVLDMLRDSASEDSGVEESPVTRKRKSQSCRRRRHQTSSLPSDALNSQSTRIRHKQKRSFSFRRRNEIKREYFEPLPDYDQDAMIDKKNKKQSFWSKILKMFKRKK